MKRFLKWSGLAAFAALLPLLMAPSGGFPSFPTFGGVHINNHGVASFTQLALDTPTAGTVPNYLSFNTAGATKAVILNERSAGGNCGGDAVDDLCVRTSGGKIRFSTDSGASSFSIPRVSYGSISPGSGTCALGSTAIAQSQNFASCNCNASGACQVVFTTSYTTNPPACTVGGFPFAGTTSGAHVTSALVGSVTTQTLAGTTNVSQISGGLIVYCVGT